MVSARDAASPADVSGNCWALKTVCPDFLWLPCSVHVI